MFGRLCGSRDPLKKGDGRRSPEEVKSPEEVSEVEEWAGPLFPLIQIQWVRELSQHPVPQAPSVGQAGLQPLCNPGLELQ